MTKFTAQQIADLASGTLFTMTNPDGTETHIPSSEVYADPKDPLKSDRPRPWKAISNSWRYTTIYDANDTPVCRLDLEDWGVTESNQSILEGVQAKVASLIVLAVNRSGPPSSSP